MRKLLVVGLMLGAGSVIAADAPVTQKTDKGEVNWSQKTVTATGSGTFSNSSGNAAQARLTATKAAKMDAQRNLLEIVKGVQVSSGKAASAVMSNNEIKAKVEGVIKGFEVVDTKYFADGGVDVVIRVPLDGVLTEALLPEGAGAGKAGDTALILDATGLGVEPALAPRVLDENGKELFSAAMVSKEKIHDAGVCAYAKSVDAAKADKRAGGKPTILKAAKRAPGSKTDIVVNSKDAAQVASAGYLIVVVD